MVLNLIIKVAHLMQHYMQSKLWVSKGVPHV